jgi:hypothetical protein
VLAFAAGAVPLFLAIVASLIELHYGGLMIFVGSAGTTLWLAALASAALFVIGAIAGWRSGNRWLIGAGGLLLALPIAPSLLLLAACAQGNCI